MKKIAVLLTICLCCILSCNQPMKTAATKGTSTMDNEQLLLEKEKKTQVKEKNYTADDWFVKLTSKLEDIRTLTEKYNNAPPKNNIVNSVLFQKNIINGTPYNPSFKVIKTISENNKIDFILETTIITLKDVTISENTAISIKLSDNDMHKFNAKVTSQPYKGLENYVHTIICITTVDINKINKWRLYKKDTTVILNTDNTPFDFVLPQIFMQYLNEI